MLSGRMSVIQELMKKPRPTDTLAISIFLGATLYAVVSGQIHTLVAGLAFTLMMLGGLPKQMALAFLVGASVIILLQKRVEGFTSGPVSGSSSGSSSGTAESTKAGLVPSTVAAPAEPFGNKVVLPDNADRKEPLVLGKPYKLPNENDDKGFHIDSGTTFLNAYKALKPEQIAAMTKDTQDLMATQRNLMSTLEALKPMLSDGQNMMNMFGSFFGPKA